MYNVFTHKIEPTGKCKTVLKLEFEADYRYVNIELDEEGKFFKHSNEVATAGGAWRTVRDDYEYLSEKELLTLCEALNDKDKQTLENAMKQYLENK